MCVLHDFPRTSFVDAALDRPRLSLLRAVFTDPPEAWTYYSMVSLANRVLSSCLATYLPIQQINAASDLLISFVRKNGCGRLRPLWSVEYPYKHIGSTGGMTPDTIFRMLGLPNNPFPAFMPPNNFHVGDARLWAVTPMSTSIGVTAATVL